MSLDKTFGFIPILIDHKKLQRVKITCRCGTTWVEDIPGEIHDSAITMALFCPSCEAEFHLCNKQLTRTDRKGKPQMPSGSWLTPEGNA